MFCMKATGTYTKEQVKCMWLRCVDSDEYIIAREAYSKPDTGYQRCASSGFFAFLRPRCQVPEGLPVLVR